MFTCYITPMTVQNQKLIQWVNHWSELCTPDNVHWCDGSDSENRKLFDEMTSTGFAIKLNEAKRPGSYYFRTDPSDVARVEERTFICSEKQSDAGHTNNWVEPSEMRAVLTEKYRGCMQGRTMYIIPFSMGPLGSPFSLTGVEITDSPYVVVNMRIMTRMGKSVPDIPGNGDFVRCIHSVGVPLQPGQKDTSWPCTPINEKYISHFPETREVWSFGSGYGGNALLGKKCFALRIASSMARDQGWMAEHMLIMGITSPEGEKKYFAAAFPSACGKTNLAMLVPAIPGWSVSCVGDDIAWLRFGSDGRLYAVNPESGFFGVAPFTSMETNPNAMFSIKSNTIFTNVGLTPDKDIWWEGIGYEMPEGTLNWKNEIHDPASGEPCAHANSRFTAPASQCPVIDNGWENPEGVPVSAIIFGGRRSTTVPLVHQSFDWKHGVFMGSIIGSEITAAVISTGIGNVRRDPFAMLPFCGYNMGDYFAHWLKIGEEAPDKTKLPLIFAVDWFRKNNEGGWLWPGYGDNIRVLKWIFDRCDGKASAKETPIGYLPAENSIDCSGLNGVEEAIKELISVDKAQWLKEIELIRGYFAQFNPLPEEMAEQLAALAAKFSKY
ncbi:MAG TPA: phosphoenolpyruvate carboxykinase (GTP) [Spirochaetota bacterium]|nr:phosphoenolpyruvate carboxykinase (GTP) [Spirochaetota bacterium]